MTRRAKQKARSTRSKAQGKVFAEAMQQYRTLRARFDAAQTTPDNRKHWANADGFDADSSGNSEVRRVLRNRARYEVANNPNAKGIVLTLANDVIGPGPRLQMLLGNEDEEDPEANPQGGMHLQAVNRKIEREFHKWMKKVHLAAKLRTMRMSKVVDGESFAVMIRNPKLDCPVKLDIRLVEADQVATPNFNALALAGKLDGSSAVDGIRFDADGNPTEYDVLLQHPGSMASGFSVLKSRPIAAQYMIHWYRQDRPSQSRGLSELTASLPIFPKIRQYGQATLDAAISAALIAIFMKSDTPAGGEAAEVPPMTEMEFSNNMAVFGPEGWEPVQIKAEQPVTTYSEFSNTKVGEAARPLNMPKNIALCDSSGYNYASGRLDHQTYFKSIDVERDEAEETVLDRIFEVWIVVAAAEYGFGVYDDWPHQWFWTGREHVDPAKEAAAQAQRLASNTTTLSDEYGKQGQDWEPKIRQRAKEITLCKDLGLPSSAAVTIPPADLADEEDQASQKQPARKSKVSQT